VFGILSLLSSPIGWAILGLIVLCIVHAVRTGNVFPWIYVLVFLPAIGALIYFFMVIVPGLRHSRGFQRFGAKAARTIDPDKDYRAAIREAEMVGSVDAKRQLAEHLVQRGKYPEAIELYQNALEGQFREDPVLWLGLGRAQFLNGDGAAAQRSLDELQRIDPKFVSPDAHLLYVRALELQGKNEDALAEYERLVPYFSGEEARCRYAALLMKTGRQDEARAIYAQVLKSFDGAPSHYRKTQKQWRDAARVALQS
jgi:hypothetical protein